MIFQDARIPLVFGSIARAHADDAVFAEGDAPAWPGAKAHFTPAPQNHPPGCTCCATRSDAARALTHLLHARARNQVPFFRRVVAITLTDQGRAEIETALANDAVVSTCFKAM